MSGLINENSGWFSPSVETQYRYLLLAQWEWESRYWYFSLLTLEWDCWVKEREYAFMVYTFYASQRWLWYLDEIVMDIWKWNLFPNWLGFQMKLVGCKSLFNLLSINFALMLWFHSLVVPLSHYVFWHTGIWGDIFILCSLD